MKFTDGYWMVRDGFTLDRPAEAYDVWSRDTSAGGTALGILAPTGRIRSRGDTLNRSAATITISSPLPGVIRVRIDRHTGGPDGRPAFELPGAGLPPVSIDAQAPVASFESGGLSARVSREPLRIDFDHDGRRLTSCLPRSIGLARGPDGAPFVFQQLSLGVGELVYGLGERFGPVVKNGQSIDIWNADGGTSSEQAYKNVPFFWTTNGYGIFVNHPERVSFEIGSEAVSRSQFSVPGDHLEYFVIAGPTSQGDPRPVHRAHRPAAADPASGRSGLWLSTSFTTDYDETDRHPASSTAWPSARSRSASSISTASGCASSAGATSSGTREPSPSRRRCSPGSRQRGLRVCVWINPYIAQLSPLFEEGRAQGYLVTRRRTAASGSGTSGRPAWRWSTSPIRLRREWFSAQAGAAARPGRGRLQDRLRRAHPDRRGLARRLRSRADAQLLHPAVQPDRLRPARAPPG